MEIVKNIAAILGAILTLSGVITLFSDKAKAAIGKMFAKFGNEDEMLKVKDSIDELNKKWDNFIEEDKKFKAEMRENNEIAIEFTRNQCRDIIKNIFYKYCDEEKLPVYEWKTLLKIEELYINRCHGNSYAAGLIQKMKTWLIDYSKQVDED